MRAILFLLTWLRVTLKSAFTWHWSCQCLDFEFFDCRPIKYKFMWFLNLLSVVPFSVARSDKNSFKNKYQVTQNWIYRRKEFIKNFYVSFDFHVCNLSKSEYGMKRCKLLTIIWSMTKKEIGERHKGFRGGQWICFDIGQAYYVFVKMDGSLNLIYINVIKNTNI